MSRWRSRAVDAVMVAVGSLVLLGALEVVARLSGWETPRETVSVPRELSVKVPGTSRIAVVGGSTVWGAPVPQLGFVAQFASALARLAPERRVEVVNLGGNGRASDGVVPAVAEIVDESLDLLIVLTGHNEYLRPLRSSAFEWLHRRSALVRGIAARTASPGGNPATAYRMSERLLSYPRNLAFRERARAFADNLEAIVELARARAVPLLLLTAPSNVAGWAPVHRGIAWARDDPDYDAHVARIAELLATQRAGEALALADQLLGAYGDDAMLLYLTAQALRSSDRAAEAKPLLERARDLDPYPWRASSEINASIRALATRPGVTVVDVDRVFVRAAANGSPGFDLFVDNCHPNEIGNARIVAAILRTLAEEKLILTADTPIPSPESVLEHFQRGLGSAGARRGLRLEWFLRSGRYAMKEPWYDFALARRYLESGAAIAPGDWRSWANLGTLALLDADRDRGVALLRKATALRGAPLDLADSAQLPYLGDAMERHGLDLATFD